MGGEGGVEAVEGRCCSMKIGAVVVELVMGRKPWSSCAGQLT